jgi:hypothetical protein
VCGIEGGRHGGIVAALAAAPMRSTMLDFQRPEPP